jgi:lysine 2,3-aminomutase
LFKKKNIDRLYYSNPTVHGIIKDAPSVHMARHLLNGYLTTITTMLSRESHRLEPLEWSTQNHCIQTFRKIVSARSEIISRHSILKLLIHLARGEFEKLPPDLNDGFFQEAIHLFLGMQGRSGIYDQEPFPEYAKKHGREAGILRSNQLDEMAEVCHRTIQRYPTGLDPNIVAVRRRNRRRILSVLGGSESDWNDPKWQMRHVIRNADQLESLIQLKSEEKEAIERARENRLPFGVTPYYVSLMDREPHRRKDHAVRAQVIPPMSYVDAMIRHKKKLHSSDFMLENDTSPIDLITRRYPMIVILKPFNTCSQICVYCQRNWEINDVLAPRAKAPRAKLMEAIQWIREHPMVREVLVTGGDPLVMVDKQVDEVLYHLSEIDHVERIRIGSRTPVVLPMRISDALIRILAGYHIPGRREITLVTHFEHAYEVTPEALESVQKFKRCGMSVYNQAVFTIENSRRFELGALRRVLRLIGVDNYYTFSTKGKEETEAYQVPMARLRQEVKEEARLFSGLVRTDEPVYNVPGLGKNYVRALQHHSILTILPNGRRVYEFHPWEKNLSLADTYIDVDVSIHDYLKALKKRGENPEDYRSIWYYY